jgi:hypothetical protein
MDDLALYPAAGHPSFIVIRILLKLPEGLREGEREPCGGVLVTAF